MIVGQKPRVVRRDAPYGKSNLETVGAAYAPPFHCAGIILGAHLGEQGTISQIKKKGACPGNAGQAPDDSNLVFRRFGLESSDFRYGMAKVRPVTTAAWLRAAVLFHGIW
jgi:hypothetical protein